MGYFYKKCQNLSKNECVLEENKAQIEQVKEQGRSMVEMLGVLAIVGVLSIGAISGYRYAMNKYRANQVVNELNLLSHQVAIAMMSKNGVTELKLGEPYDTNKKLTSSGYQFEFGCGDGSAPFKCADQTLFYFNVQNISKDVCKEILSQSQYLQYLVKQTDDCTEYLNELNFVFNPQTSFEEFASELKTEDNVTTSITEEQTDEETPVSSSFLVSEQPIISSSYIPPVLTQEDVSAAFCSGNGYRYYGKCRCDKGYKGINCEIEDTDCSGHGTFNGTTCVCDSQHYGQACQFSVSECEKHGSFNGYSCYCSGTWGGEECNIENACNGKGLWDNTVTTRCVCNSGYGEFCELWEDPCVVGSWYDWSGSCICSDNYEGVYCNFPQGSICKKGTWRYVDGSSHCVCSSGYTGQDCSIQVE